MEKFIRSFLVAGLSLGFISVTEVRAAGVVVDFNGETENTFLTADYFEDGFKVEATGHYDFFSAGGVFPAGGTGGTTFINVDAVHTGPSTVEFTTNGFFELLSVDVILPGGLLQSSAGGSMVLGTAGIQTFSGANWDHLTWITLSSDTDILGEGGVDTFSFATPIPAALPLFLSGLLGLRFVGRRRARSA